MGEMYAWWPYVRNMVKRYPVRIKAEQMSFVEAREAEAVLSAIRDTKALPDGEDRMKLIKRIYWDRNRVNLQGAAMEIPVSYSTARRWNREFFLEVAGAFGLWDPEYE